MVAFKDSRNKQITSENVSHMLSSTCVVIHSDIHGVQPVYMLFYRVM